MKLICFLIILTNFVALGAPGAEPITVPGSWYRPGRLSGIVRSFSCSNVFDNPGVEVTVNGQKIPPLHPSAFISIPAPKSAPSDESQSFVNVPVRKILYEIRGINPIRGKRTYQFQLKSVNPGRNIPLQPTQDPSDVMGFFTRVFSQNSLEQIMGFKELSLNSSGLHFEFMRRDVLAKQLIEFVSAEMSPTEIEGKQIYNLSKEDIFAVDSIKDKVITRLEKVYHQRRLPKKVAEYLWIQEEGLAEVRSRETMVLSGSGRLLTYSRLYLGDRSTPEEKTVFNHNIPQVTLWRLQMELGSFPVALLPIERVLKPSSTIRQSINRLRELDNHMVVELGRTYFDNIDPELLNSAKILHFTLLYREFLKLASETNVPLENIHIFVNSGPSNKRLYERFYGLESLPTDAKLDRFIENFGLDNFIVLEGETDLEATSWLGFQNHEDTNLHYLHITAQRFFGNLLSKGIIRDFSGNSKGCSVSVDPRYRRMDSPCLSAFSADQEF